MELDLCGEKVVNNPDAQILADLIEKYSGRPDFYVIPGVDWQTYMQAAADSQTGYRIEYRDGSPMTHYYCAHERIERSDVIRAMTMYLKRDSRWRNELLWHPMI